MSSLFLDALGRVASLDPEVVSITLRTLLISGSATLMACLLAVPCGMAVHFASFRGKRAVTGTVQTLYSIPTVLVGLLIYLFLSRSGPLGSLGMLFTPSAIALGQALLVSPVVMGLTLNTLEGAGPGVHRTALALGAGRVRAALAVMLHVRHAWSTVFLMAFGRAVSEVGVAMMAGGNIRGYTRTLTTAISLGLGRGDNAESVALGIVLLLIASGVTLLAGHAGRLSRGA